MRAIPSLLIAAFLIAPVASAELAEPEEHVQVVVEFDANGEHYYLVDNHGALQLWLESNGLATAGQPYALEEGQSGLQASETCLHADGRYTYQGDADEGEFDPDFCTSAGATRIEMDTQITNSSLLAIVEDALP